MGAWIAWEREESQEKGLEEISITKKPSQNRKDTRNCIPRKVIKKDLNE